MSWNGSGTHGQTPRSEAPKTKTGESGVRKTACLIAIPVVAVLAFVAMHILNSSPDAVGKDKPDKKAGLIKEVKPAAAPKAEETKKEEPKKEEPKLGPNQFIRNGRVMTRSEGVHAYYYDKKGRKILVLNVDDGPRKMQKSIFATPVEDTLAMYLEPAEDLPPPPREDFSQEEIMQALMAKIEIDAEKDSETDQWRKQAMIAMKGELKQFIKDGGTFGQFLRQLQRRQEKEGALMKETRNMVIQQIKSGDIEGAKTLKAKFNEHLSEKGLPAMKLPPPYRKALGEPVGTLGPAAKSDN